LPWRELSLSGRYTWSDERNDGESALSLPASSLAPEEWGPASGARRHRLSIVSRVEPHAGVQIGLTVRAESGAPYTMTTGLDGNDDGLFNDRPEGIGRNSLWGEGLMRVDLRASWQIGIGAAAGAGRGAAAQPQSGDTPRDGRRGAVRSSPLLMAEIYLNASNLLNAVHPTRYSGVLTSPFFGQPTSAGAARRFELGTRIRF
jgi:hypothetical protein